MTVLHRASPSPTRRKPRGGRTATTVVRRPVCPRGRPASEERLPLDSCWHWEGRPAADDMNAILDFVAEAMTAAGYGDDDRFGVRLALAEAVSNAIRHGHRGDLTRPVRVRHHVDARRVLVEVEDEGGGFDPGPVPDPRAPQNRERAGGRGLFLMRAYLDGVRYHGRGNCVTLCKCRSGS